MPIEVYSARHAGFVHPAEERVLARVVRILEARQLDAVLVANITTDNGECDLLVATNLTTLTLEIKQWREPVSGGFDGGWRGLWTGRPYRNAWQQAHDAMLGVKDRLARWTRLDPGYVKAFVLFEGGIPAGSDLKSDFRVGIAGDDDLAGLLVEPSRENRRWDPDMLRRWAQAQAFRPVRSIPASIPAPTRYPDARVRLPAVIVLDAPRPAVVDATRPEVMRAPLRGRTGKAIAWTLGLAVCAAFAAGAWRFHHAGLRPRDPLQVAAPGHVATADRYKHVRPPARLHAHRELPVVASTGTAPSPVWPEVPPPVLSSTQPPAPLPSATPLQPCPPGIDRLGCQADPETLRRLRGH